MFLFTMTEVIQLGISVDQGNKIALNYLLTFGKCGDGYEPDDLDGGCNRRS